MDFSKLRHRIIFLRPTDTVTNSMGETVPRYKPLPYLPFPCRFKVRMYILSMMLMEKCGACVF